MNTDQAHLNSVMDPMLQHLPAQRSPSCPDGQPTAYCTTKRWLQPDQLTTTKVTERVAMDWFLQALPSKEQKAIEIQNPSNPREMLEAL